MIGNTTYSLNPSLKLLPSICLAAGLGDARANYGIKLIEHLGQQLAQEFGRGFEFRNLHRMMRFSEAFPDPASVSTLSTQLSWSHMIAIVSLKNPQAHQFYVQQATQDGWRVRELHAKIDLKAFERNEIANTNNPAPAMAHVGGWCLKNRITQCD